jgi:hypothetical protein
MNHSRTRFACGVLLVAGCVWLLIGCVITRDSQDPSRQVGDAASERPLRVMQASRAQVLAVLGEPWFTSANQRLIGYRWTKTSEQVSLCASYTTVDNLVLLLGFDENDMLKSFQVSKDRPALRDEINSMLPPGQSLKPELKKG